MVKGIFDPTIGALNTSLNLRQMRQNVLSSNIANADTPEYKAKDIDFDQAFREALIGSVQEGAAERTHPAHQAPGVTDPVHAEIYDVPNDIVGLDGNTVDRAEQMAKLSENQLLYDASVELIKKKLGMLGYAISEGGGNR